MENEIKISFVKKNCTVISKRFIVLKTKYNYLPIDKTLLSITVPKTNKAFYYTRKF